MTKATSIDVARYFRGSYLMDSFTIIIKHSFHFFAMSKMSYFVFFVLSFTSFHKFSYIFGQILVMLFREPRSLATWNTSDCHI